LYAQGEKLFRGNCASCHKPDKDMTGPAIAGSRARWEGKGDIYAWIKNSQAVVKSGNAYAVELFNKWNKGVMTPQALTDEEIDAVLYYADNYTPPAPPTPPPGDTAGGGGGAAPGGPAWPWLIVLALLFIIVGMSLGGVRKTLDNAVREAEGKGPAPELTTWQSIKLWAWNHKIAATVVGLFVFVYIIVQLWNWAFVIGVYGGDQVANYRPEQPIAFNHTLHAGKDNLAINCQYCHSSAEKSKHAGIPSANVCMNCHKAVDAGTVTGTTEIAKIYRAVGWDPASQAYTGTPEPIRWVKVHNLPDHAYFSHAQHVAVGKLECQECHGPVDTEMTVAEQWAPLTMGWCIQCHNDREPKMEGNGYYDEVMARLQETDLGHRELRKYLEDDRITVKELGGWECAKCHY
jgi:cytochrome c551/c552